MKPKAKYILFFLLLLQSLNRDGHTVIVVTHNPDMEAYAGRTIRVQDGECFT